MKTNFVSYGKHIKWALLLAFALMCNILPGVMLQGAIPHTAVSAAEPEVTPTPEEFFDELFPGLPPFSTNYATSYDELTENEKEQIREEGYYISSDGERHRLFALSGSLSGQEDEAMRARLLNRAEFTIEDVETDWAKRLSSDGTVHVRMFLVRTYFYAENMQDKFSGRYRDLICLYGDKAEKWFIGMGGSLRPQKEIEGTYTTPQHAYSASYETRTGYLEYDPVVTATKEYVDWMVTDDIGFLHIFVHYADDELLYPESLQLQLDGMDQTVALEDMKHNMAFKGGLVSTFMSNQTARQELQAKYEAIYNDENDYDPFLDPASTPKPGVDPTEAPEETAEPTERPTADPTVVPTIEPSAEPSAAPTEAPAATPDTITVTIGGQKVEAEDTLIVVNDRVLIPMRAVFEALGAAVAWENEERIATAVQGANTIKIRIGEEWFTKNGVVLEMDVPSIIYHDRTYVPIRAVSEALERTVHWDSLTKTVTIE